ncbi:FMN reductase [Neptunitalea chrysea]|uniref:FMN reductase n=1 Tax=Neptunitalea chrysea TaxID=1647581 RepID=A0A9W6B4G1_9FLAO|nr:NAD(P)H-dependent oxidoreductase [Neptunitalea chrysea]GLB52361.1 FMN reductase [Neptunitalea chrysea]
MEKIIAFAGSNSSKSINFQLVKYTVSLIEGLSVDTLDMSEMPFPIYSEDEERKEGFKNALVELVNDIQDSDGLVISVNEHNGNMSAYFKNLIDWMSRFNRNFLEGKKIFLMSTSEGKFGASKSLEATSLLLPRFGGEVITTFSLPSYSKHFSASDLKITDEALSKEHQDKLNQFLEA